MTTPPLESPPAPPGAEQGHAQTDPDPPAPAPDPPAPVPGSPRAAPTVLAVLVAHNGARWLPECLDALAASTRHPDRLVIVDVASSDASAEIADGHVAVRDAIGSVRVVHSPALVPFAAAVSLGVEADEAARPGRTGGSPTWLWLLHDDSAVGRSALEELLRAVSMSPSVGVAGPKLVEWDRPLRLIEVGAQLTRAGRLIASPRAGERDQGQYDRRTDVLAVATTGMLVRRDVYDSLGGFDRAFADAGGDLDLGWRAQLAGYRVIVVPPAVVRDATAMWAGTRTDGRSPAHVRRTRRRAARSVALARCSAALAPLLAVWIALGGVLAALALLVLKRPRHALAELSDLGAVLWPWRSVGARWRGRVTRAVRPRDLGVLFVSGPDAARHVWDHVHEAVTPALLRPADDVVPAPLETGPVAEEAEDLTLATASLTRRALTHPGLLAVLVAAAASTYLWRRPLTAGLLDAQGSGLTGGELRPVSTDAAGLWHAFRDSWHGPGLGTSAEAHPHLAVLAGLSWLVEKLPYAGTGRSPVSVTLAWLLFTAVPLATMTAYCAARVATRARWLRAVLALGWGTSGVLAAGVSQGRAGAAVVHVLLPLVLAGIALAASARGTNTTTFATALAVAAIGVFVPAVLVLCVLAALGILVAGPGVGRRWRGLVLAVVPPALLGAWVITLAADPALVLTGPGLMTPEGAGAAPWRVVLADPVAVGAADATWGSWTSYLVAPLVVLAVVALLRSPGARGRSVALGGLAVVTVTGLGMSLAAPRLRIGTILSDSGAVVPASPWAGAGLQLYLLGVLAILVTAADGLRPVVLGGGLLRRVAALVGIAAVTGGVLGALAVSASSALGLKVGGQALPAVAAEQAEGPLANRLLVITPGPASIDLRLVGREPGDVLRSVLTNGPIADRALPDLVQALTSGSADTTGAAARLADEGIGFLSLVGPSGGAVARALDATSGLTRLGTTDGQSLWRVQARTAAPGGDSVPPVRVWVTDSTGAPLAAVPVSGPHATLRTALAAGPIGRRLRVAEPARWADDAEVRLDGALLSALPGGAPAYALPPEPGTLEITLPAAHRRWHLAQLALLGFVVFMGVPFGTRRSRRDA